ncbi:MAG: DUF3179 domain-containing protein [Acidobacteria bacterium]|nr:DUF3179 domain-containing protein [Acidobacteriota bacterium]
MVYGREVDGRELNFEASGALLEASLVMRDRETDSWWSIMTSDAIGGELEGEDLEELPVSEKVQWRDWVRKHPDTKVLSINGVEHVRNNPYDNYFTSANTFRGLKIDDRRLPPKEPVYTFRLDGKPVAIPQSSFEGGALFELPGVEGQRIFLYRDPGSSFFASSSGFLVSADASIEDLRERIRTQNTGGLERLDGFDTYWYSWVSVNPKTELIR